MARNSFSLIVVVMFFCAYSYGKGYHITKAGTSSGDGSIEKPWSIEYAFDRNNRVYPRGGDTVYIHEGTYVTDIHVWFGGDEKNNVIITNYQDDFVIIDGNTGKDEPAVIYIQPEGGGYVTIEGLVITNSNKTRYTDYEGSFPPMPQGKSGIMAAADNYTIKNNIIHDNHSNGIGAFAGNANIHGNLIYYNGWDAPDRSHAYGLYVQNGDPAKATYITNNFIFSNFNKGFHVYVTKGTSISNIHIADNIIFESGSPSEAGAVENNIFVGGLRPMDGIELLNNHTFLSRNDRGNSIRVGYYEQANKNIKVIGNYAIGGKTSLLVRYAENLELRENVVHSKSYWLTELTHDTEDLSTYNWDENDYYYTGNRLDFMNALSWEEWKANYNFDNRSTFSSEEPIGSEFFVKYQSGNDWAGLVVYDWQKVGYVDVDISSVVSVGDRYFIYDAQHIYDENSKSYFSNPIASDVYNGGTVRVPTGLTNVSPVNGNDLRGEVKHTPQEFNTYVIKSSKLISGECVIKIESIIPITVFEEFIVSFNLEGDCKDPVNAVLLDSKNEVIGQFDNVSSNFEISMPGVCESCNEGTYAIRLESGELNSSKSFTYKPLQLENCSPEQTTGTFEVMFYSPVDDEVLLSVIESGGIKVINDSIINATKGDNIATVDISGYEKGNYTVSLEFGKRLTLGRVTKIDPPKELELINYSPQETYDEFSISYISPRSERITLRIFNDDNNELYSETLTATLDQQSSKVVDLNKYEAGVYRVELDDGYTVQECSVIKLRSLEIISYTPTETLNDVLISYYSPVTENVLIEVLSSTGNTMMSISEGALVGESNQIELDISRLVAGDYRIKLGVESLNQTDECVVTRLEDPRKLEVIECAPKQTIDNYVVTFYSPLTANIDIEIIDINEEIVHTEVVGANQGENNVVTLSISNQTPGVYTTRLTLSEKDQVVECEITRLEDPRVLEIISCSPKQTYGAVSLTFYSPITKNISVRILNEINEEVFTDSYAAVMGDNNVMDLDLGGYSSGTFTIELNDGQIIEECMVNKIDKEEPRKLGVINHTRETNSFLNIEYYSPKSTVVTFEVLDNDGKTVFSTSQNATVGNNEISIEVKVLNPGDYKVYLDDEVSNVYFEFKRTENPRSFSFISSKPRITNDLFEISFYSPIEQKIEITVVDKAKRIVFQENQTAKVGENKEVLNLSKLNDGKYKVNVSNGNEVLSCKVVVQRLLIVD